MIFAPPLHEALQCLRGTPTFLREPSRLPGVSRALRRAGHQQPTPGRGAFAAALSPAQMERALAGAIRQTVPEPGGSGNVALRHGQAGMAGELLHIPEAPPALGYFACGAGHEGLAAGVR